MCEKHGVPHICDFNLDDRHKVARFAGEMVRAWYIEGILPGLRTLSENALSEDEIAEVIKAAESVKIPAECFVFNDEKSLLGVEGTCYHSDDDKIYVTRDVFPDRNELSLHPRNILSVRSILAIEYYGRRKYCMDNSSTSCDWRTEVECVTEASRFAPGLTQYEKAMLILYAGCVAEEHGYSINSDEYDKSIISGDGTAEPVKKSINYESLEEIYDMVEEAKKEMFGYKPAEDDKVLETAQKLMDEFDEAFKELAK